MKRFPYVIAGASIAGLSAAAAIRSRDPSGRILLIHGEDRLPYKRTQLSKQLARGFSGDELALHPREWFSANNIELLQGVRAVSVASSAREVALSTGDVVGYESLLIASGAAPAVLSIPGSQHIMYLRGIDQAETMSRRLREIGSAVSVGFGVQGIELADQFASAGLATTLLGRRDTLMDRSLDAESSRRLEERITAAGVSVRRGGKVLAVQEANGRYRVMTEKGEIDAEMVSASVGAVSVTDLALSAGLAPHGDEHPGITAGRDMRTEIPGIYAAGDAARPLPGASWGLWHAAESAGMIAGTNMAGGDVRPEPRPRRLKCEAFGGYLFSLNYPEASRDGATESRVLRSTKALYLRIWEREGRSVAALLDANPNPGQAQAKALGKTLERLILDGAAADGIPAALGA